MTLTGAAARTARSRPVLVTGTLLVAMLVAWASGAWTGNVDTVGKVRVCPHQTRGRDTPVNGRVASTRFAG